MTEYAADYPSPSMPEPDGGPTAAPRETMTAPESKKGWPKEVLKCDYVQEGDRWPGQGEYAEVVLVESLGAPPKELGGSPGLKVWYTDLDYYP
jgi:hypothetical protein